MSATTTKNCSKCRRAFPASPEYFWRNSNQPDGLVRICKTCCFEMPCMRRRTPSSNLRGKPLSEKIKRSIVIDKNGCWIWQKGISSGGYGKLNHRRKDLLAHRVSYAAFKGEIPAGLQIDHLCRNRKCCNPDHLEAVTLKVNIQRGAEATKLYCSNGHPFSGDNLYVPPQRGRNKKRGCRACAREATRRYRERKRLEAETKRNAA